MDWVCEEVARVLAANTMVKALDRCHPSTQHETSK